MAEPTQAEAATVAPTQAAQLATRVLCEDVVVGTFGTHEDAWFMAATWNQGYPLPEYPQFVLDPLTCDDEECVCHD